MLGGGLWCDRRWQRFLHYWKFWSIREGCPWEKGWRWCEDWKGR